MNHSSISVFFQPKTIAVIGATENPKKFGFQITSNLLNNPIGPEEGESREYSVIPISRSSKVILGLRAYPSILEVPTEIDLAMVLVPAKFVPPMVDECIQKSVKSIIIVTAGFGELGEEGKKLERDMAQKCRAAGIRVIGPNCVGIENSEIFLNASFIQPTHRGQISMISQSGSFGCALIDGLWWEHLGVSKFANIGNQMDVDFADILLYFKDDPGTKVIAIYLESLKNGTKFIQALRDITPYKPVVIFKGGRSPQGMSAALSHTGSLASDINIFRAAITQSGAILCENMHEYITAIKAFSFLPIPHGVHIGALSNSGGSGVLFSDAISDLNLTLANFSDALQETIRPHVIDLVKIQNPLDMIAGAGEEQYYAITKAMLAPDSGIDLVVPCGVSPPFLGLTFGDNYRGIIRAWNESGRKKPLLPLFIYAHGYEDVVEIAQKEKSPYFSTPYDAAYATKILIKYAKFLKHQNLR